ncbi:MAG: tryptophan-rich sensory protein [Alphaproteobacteria bacterium]|nr:tryptophan-rich sensory protein [Alphaproteobacteria bacterium]
MHRLTTPIKYTLFALLIAIGSNAAIFGLGFDGNFEALAQPDFVPEGWIIGTVWLILFAMHGYGWGLLKSVQSESASLAANTVFVLVLVNASYGFYALPLLEITRLPALLGNLLSMCIGCFAMGLAWRVSRTGALLLFPIVVWLVFATIIVGGQISLNGL